MAITMYLLNIVRSLGRGLQKHKAVLLCELLSFLGGDCPAMLHSVVMLSATCHSSCSYINDMKELQQGD